MRNPDCFPQIFQTESIRFSGRDGRDPAISRPVSADRLRARWGRTAPIKCERPFIAIVRLLYWDWILMTMAEITFNVSPFIAKCLSGFGNKYCLLVLNYLWCRYWTWISKKYDEINRKTFAIKMKLMFLLYFKNILKV